MDEEGHLVEAEVVEEEHASTDFAQEVEKDAHQNLMDEVSELLEAFPSGTGPKDPGETFNHAAKSLENARKTVAVLKKRLEETLEGAED